MKSIKLSAITLIVFTIFILNCENAHCQGKEDIFNPQKTEYNKLYIQTDREFYFAGDLIWFKAYLLNSRTNKTISSSCDLHLELIDSKNKISHLQTLAMNNGFANGCILLDDIKDFGNYFLRAYSNKDVNNIPESHFHKVIQINKVQNSSELQKKHIDQNESEQKIDLAILPEGGILLEEKMNILGLKAIDQNGIGINIKGKILDKDQNIAGHIITSYKGLGKAYFYPKAMQSYTIVLDEYPNQTFKIAKAKKSGIKLSLGRVTDDELIFTISSNSTGYNNNYYFAVLNKGVVYYYQEIEKQGIEDIIVKIKKLSLPGGVNRFILLDKDLTPISERLYFSKNIKLNNISIQTDQKQYESRSEVKLELKEEHNWIYTSNSNLAITVVDDGAYGEHGFSTTILSHLLINSELKGHIENSADFFVDEQSMKSDQKLSLLMLTQGWSQYIWNILPEKTMQNKKQNGFSIGGRIKRLLNEKSISNASITAAVFQNEYLLNIYESISDSLGQFRIDGLSFRDSATIFIQALNKRGKNYTEIELRDIEFKHPELPNFYDSHLRSQRKIPYSIYKQRYYNNLALKEFKPEEGSIDLKEVTIRDRKIVKDEHINQKILAKVDKVIKPTDRDAIYTNMANYLMYKLPGFVTTGGYMKYRGKFPTFMLNGVKVGFSDIMNISPHFCEKIEVLNRAERVRYGSTMRVIIAFYTKRGSSARFNMKPTTGIITKKIAGYSKYRSFYSPKYYTEEDVMTEMPDIRTTLYWNPGIITEKGSAELSFYTSDNLGNYTIFVEGVSNNGHICIGKTSFTVNNYNSLLSKTDD